MKGRTFNLDSVSISHFHIIIDNHCYYCWHVLSVYSVSDSMLSVCIDHFN